MSPGGASVCQKPSRQAILPQNRPDFRVIARPQRGRGNLKAEGMASHGEAREYEAKGNSYHKKHGNRCVVLLPLSFSFRATIFRFGMTNRFVKDCRVGRTRPPRNDRIGRFDRKHGTQNPIFGFRKTFLICCLILTVPDFFDSLKHPRGSDESRGRCCLCGKLCAADFRKLSAEAFGQNFSRTSHPRLSVGASVELRSRCFRPELQPGFTADAFGRFFSRFSKRPWNRRT